MHSFLTQSFFLLLQRSFSQAGAQVGAQPGGPSARAYAPPRDRASTRTSAFFFIVLHSLAFNGRGASLQLRGGGEPVRLPARVDAGRSEVERETHPEAVQVAVTVQAR